MKRKGEKDEEEVDLGLKLQNQDGGPTSNMFITTSDTFLKPSGGISREEMGCYPFTVTQWKELERQALIYKYMVSSLPVPSHLLYPNAHAFSPLSYFLGRYGNELNCRWLGNSKEAEPMRCRRTDGKKWRCSREVAPNQKYCERHMHRGKPRSRKPVELVFHPHKTLSELPINTDTNFSPNKKTRMNEPSPQTLACSNVSPFDHTMVSGDMPFDYSRSLVGKDAQQWQQLVQTSMTNQALQHQLQGNQSNLNTYVGFDAEPDMTLRPLMDHWPMVEAGNRDNSVINNGRNGTTIDEDTCQIQMGLQVTDSWADSLASPGGPLAEVLRPGCTNRSALNLMTSSDVGEWDFVTPPATAVSSPSGVLHKTPIASFSDSSGSSSPTCPISRANTDVPFHWLN